MSIGGPLLLIGCGKMGGAMLRGWLQRGVRAADVTVVEPYAAALADLAGQSTFHSNLVTIRRRTYNDTKFG
jgi:pyrroline-5-carboxylate reductase